MPQYQQSAGTLANPQPKEIVIDDGTTLQVEIPHNGKSGNGTFIMVISLPGKSNCECGCSTSKTCLCIGAMLWFRSAGIQAGVSQFVGRVEGHIVDKSDKQAFAHELLKAKINEDCYEYELKIMMRNIFDRSGNLRPAYQRPALMKVQNMLVIDILRMEPENRGAGFGKLTLTWFERYAKKAAIFELGKFSGTVLLSPTQLDDDVYPEGKSDWDIDSELILFYRKCGYVLYHRGDSVNRLKGGINLVGKKI